MCYRSSYLVISRSPFKHSLESLHGRSGLPLVTARFHHPKGQLTYFLTIVSPFRPYFRFRERHQLAIDLFNLADCTGRGRRATSRARGLRPFVDVEAAATRCQACDGAAVLALGAVERHGERLGQEAVAEGVA
jgi:hypothetical protein